MCSVATSGYMGPVRMEAGASGGIGAIRVTPAAAFALTRGERAA